jgi:hypothetical protein
MSAMLQNRTAARNLALSERLVALTIDNGSLRVRSPDGGRTSDQALKPSIVD